MVECCPNSQPLNVPSVRKATKMSGVDTKQPDRFSNASLLSILTRSYSKTTPVTSNSSTFSTVNTNAINGNNNNVNGSKVSPSPRSSPFFGKENDKTPTLLSRFSITSGLSGQNSSKGQTQRISKGPGSNIYVSHYYLVTCHVLTLEFIKLCNLTDLLPMREFEKTVSISRLHTVSISKSKLNIAVAYRYLF